MILFMDFESRAVADIKNGAYRYAEDANTDVLCLAIMFQGYWPMLWVPEKFRHLCSLPVISDDELKAYVHAATELHAHNMQFERRMWKHIMADRYGFPDLPLEKCRCTAAKAAVMNIPRNLDGACKAMGLPGKDKAGKEVMLRMCKPRRILKADRAKWEPEGWVDSGSYLYHPLTDEYKYLWHETPEEFEKNARYCMNDVEIECALDYALPNLSPKELEVWRMDQRMNDRGVRVDLDLAKTIHREAKIYEEELIAQMQEATYGTVSGPTKLHDLGEFLKTRGVIFPDLQKATIKRLLKEGVADPAAKKALQIRLSASKATSCKKYEAILRCVCKGGRIHDMFMYYGAQATGRWSSKGVQLQNMARGELTFEEVMDAIAQFLNYGGVSSLDVLEVASSCVRSTLTATPGSVFVCADFSNIEGRIQAWFAQEQWKLDAFQAYDAGHGPDLYNLSFSRSFNVPVDKVTKAERQVGKVTELSMGYAGGIGAFANMAGNYELDLETLPPIVLPSATYQELEKANWSANNYLKNAVRYAKPGEPIMSKQAALACDVLKQRWRAAHPATKATWDTVEDAAISAVISGQAYDVGPVTIGMQGDWLRVRLPSGRMLSMFKPQVRVNSKDKHVLSFMGMGAEDKTTSRKWMRRDTYGGDIYQSIVQAIARDIMAEAMLLAEPVGFSPVLTVHDEAAAEIANTVDHEAALGMFESLLATVPSWAPGLPVAVAGWYGFRYRKD